MTRFLRPLLAAGALLVSAGFAATAAPSAPASDDGLSRTLAAVSAKRISARIRFLADDYLEGRGTGARGSEIAARYIAAEFAEDGLVPAGKGGSYLQNFEMVGVSTDPSSELDLETPNGKIALKNGENSVLSTRDQRPEADIEAPVLFVGYGITAPEMHWDDYAKADAAGKILVCLVNDPPSPDPKFFGGKGLTYYGRWTYKYEEAARRHAAGILLVHTDASAGYGWQVVRNSWSGEQAQLPLENGERDDPVNGWITKETAERLFADNGMTLEDMIARAGKPGFVPVPLETRAKGKLAFKVRRYTTENVAGILPGSDPVKKDTYVAVSAHFDHLGIGAPDAKGDTIYNGAVDNGTGTALMLELARAAADGRWRPKRSILFVGVTAEEQGLIGSLYFAKHPPVPPAKIAADFNMDVTSVHGETADFSLLGLDKTSLEPLASRVARTMNVKLDPDAHPEQGSYFRSDHFSLVRAGIPAINVDPGSLIRGHDAAYGQKIFEDYNEHHYHQPSDEFDPNW
ncbi:MAG TPA: M28 family peptidase, partial [Thermoanaerobaculia bacterium]|nr:M28 family peptidase [Thermoanaerobaculia bacterium]